MFRQFLADILLVSYGVTGLVMMLVIAEKGGIILAQEPNSFILALEVIMFSAIIGLAIERIIAHLPKRRKK